jgi:hypothetical protein
LRGGFGDVAGMTAIDDTSQASASDRVAARMQILCVRWGSQYGPDSVNRLYRAIAKHTRVPFRFICITEGDGDYDAGIELRPFPQFSVPIDRLKSGCRLKLSVFEPGLLEHGVPAILFDLDTMVRGDVARIARQVARRPALYMMHNNRLPIWRFQKRFRRWLGDYSYFGNSSVLAFYPEPFEFVFDAFNRAIAATPEPVPKRLVSDDRFLSHAARDKVRVLSRRIAVKFADEYATPFTFTERLRRLLPWTARRRRQLVAVTFVGEALKPWLIASLKEGDLVQYKRRRVRWDFPDYSAYWRDEA